MTATLSATNPAKLNSFLETIAQVLGVDITLLEGNFKLEFQSIGNGDELYAVLRPGAGGPSQIERLVKAAALVIPETDAIDADTVSGTTTLVNSTKDVTITGGVPVGSAVYAIATTPAGKHKSLAAVRKNATEITISSAGDGYAALLDSAGVSGTLVAGVKSDFALANAAGDLLAVMQTAAGGAAADHFSVVRVNDTTVKAQAHDAAGALVAGNTSTVKVYNFGAKGHDTSLVRYIVVRP